MYKLEITISTFLWIIPMMLPEFYREIIGFLATPGSNYEVYRYNALQRKWGFNIRSFLGEVLEDENYE